MERLCNLILVRHGQTEWNRVERFRGHYDIPLDETGIKQGEAVAERIAIQFKPDRVFTSPLIRAMKTAEIIAKKADIPVIIHRGIIDIDYGHWQGLTPDEVKARFPYESALWYEHPENAIIPGGETLEETQARAIKTMEELCKDSTGKGIVVVSHTVVIRLILLGILCSPLNRFWNLRQEPCAINLIEYNYRGFTISSINDTCHLRKLQNT
ncbi:MAG: histidine phosphatase family protein [Spirochaetota bacterium]